MATYYIKKDNQSPVITTTILNPAGTAVDLTGKTVQLRVANMKTGTRIIDNAASIDDALNGIASYQLSDAQADNAGLFLAEWVVDLGLTSEETYPNYGYDDVYFERSL